MQRSQANTLSVLFGEVTMNAKLQLPKSPPDTTTIVKPGEDLKERAMETREEFVGKTFSVPAAAGDAVQFLVERFVGLGPIDTGVHLGKEERQKRR